ncbi:MULTISPECIES: hypothetical protein [unclassified Clostridium]|uniref:Uncharacterized protein n=1 Tax=Clostridium botulinum (strain Eklund 17B / Type B) TaxID=935198 RepID=B2TP70_CLOBB|nr:MULTISPECIES: hypothetical protein [unclassified Clostridium]ACD21946.1 hypothetical protein CLL_A2840 [Clostridium botulinum B str. Eklund 17B (NRP)]CDH91745.1 hypothetical protein CB17B2756 [Clostridium botulinum B str. Eklund 17B (NRP)]
MKDKKIYDVLKDGLMSITWVIIMIVTFKLLKIVYKMFALR